MQEDITDYDQEHFNNGDAENVEEEVDDELEIVEEVALLGLPEVRRTINRDPEELKLRKLGETKMMTHSMDSEEEVSRQMTDSLSERISVEVGRQIETKLVKNLTEVGTNVDETEDIRGSRRSKSEKRLRSPKIKIQNARIQILAKPETGENNKDDIVFIIYLNDTDLGDDENKNAGDQIEDLVFKD